MTAFLFDGTKSGLLTCVFDCFYKKIYPDVVSSSPLQCGFGDEIIRIDTDEEKAERVSKCFSKLKTRNLSAYIDFALKSGENIKYDVIFKYVVSAIKNKETDVSKNFKDETTLAFYTLNEKIKLEAHRLKGFLRFSESADGFYYAHYEPDHDVTAILMPHFAARFKYPFIIHDTKRNILGLSDGKRIKTIVYDKRVYVFLSKSEEELVSLWKNYYNAVNIKERENLKQMRNYMPLRYWKNCPEKQESIDDF